MRRRDFVFGSLQAAALLTPVLSLRRAASAEPQDLLGFVWVNCCGYPSPDDFFPTGGEQDFSLSPILADFEGLREHMVIVDGIDIRDSGLDPKGNNHVRTIGKVLTAMDVLAAPDPEDGLPGGISIDQYIAVERSIATVELQVQTSHQAHMRHRPFATSTGVFKPPLASPADAYSALFADFSASADPAAIAEHQRKLRLKLSVLDDVTDDLARLRPELDATERLKLDIHEDAIRRAESSVLADMNAELPPTCAMPPAPDTDEAITVRAAAQLDLAFAALACRRVGLASMLWGSSGYHWRYEWAGVTDVVDSGHDEVHHFPVLRRDDHVTMARWDWNELRKFLERLQATPDGEGTMLDNVLTLAISHFGYHHQMFRIPAVLIGNAQGQLATGRYLTVQSDNDKLLTSFAHLMGANISGIGNDPFCGPLPGL